MQNKMKIATLMMVLAVASACGKRGVVVPPDNQTPVENVYPAPTCLDKLVDISQADTCKK